MIDNCAFGRDSCVSEMNNVNEVYRSYPELPDLERARELLDEYARLKYEYGADRNRIQTILDETEKSIWSAIEKIRDLPDGDARAVEEPNDLSTIRSLRPDGPRRMWRQFDQDVYSERLRGGLTGRLAGCTLGAPVEFWEVDEMSEWAGYVGDEFPPVDYWSAVKSPNTKRYGVSECAKYTSEEMDGVPVDDDITYTLLGLLVMEDYGPDFSIDDVGKAWLEYLPYACTAEHVALNNLKNGVPASQCAEIDNPYVQWIGADIRSDPWGYLAPGLPEKAAELARRDAYISHRRNGIYGEMYFSAVIAAAFGADNSRDALEIGLSEIPERCLLARDIRWALDKSHSIKDYVDARRAVDDYFHASSNDRTNRRGMHRTHTNLNACLTIFGLAIGGDDFTKVIGHTVAAGYDYYCTAATAGSIIGTIKGFSGIPEHWYRRFNDTIYTYINGHPKFSIDDVINRFAVQAKRMWEV